MNNLIGKEKCSFCDKESVSSLFVFQDVEFELYYFCKEHMEANHETETNH